MAYARYSRKCDWYVFATAKEPGVEQLAIWHADHRAADPTFSLSAVKAMLDADDFSRIPGYSTPWHNELRIWLTEYVDDVLTDGDA